jgi:DUF1009 family protein
MNVSKLAIIAGKGELVENLINTSIDKNYELTILSINNPKIQNDDRYNLVKLDKINLKLIFKILQHEKITHICMAGYVDRPNRLLDFLNPFSIVLLFKFWRILERGDAALFKLLNKYIEQKGFKIIGASEINPNLTLIEGLYSKKKVPKSELRNLKLAEGKVEIIGSLDIGQSAVISKGRVLAVEAAEGTDEMLLRVIKLNSKKITNNGILFKSSQKQQDLRTDMPTIGVKTIKLLAQAKLSGIAITAGDVMVLSIDQVIELINDNGLFFIVLKKK